MASHGNVRSTTTEPGACHDRRWAMTRFTRIVAVATLTLTFAACSSGAASSPPPSASSGPVSSPSSSPSLVPVAVGTGEQAAARVIEFAPQHQGIGPKDPDLIGGCCFWEATSTADGFEVVFEVGSGDCQAGCIDRHRWTYEVTRDGAVTLISESGPPVPSGAPGTGGG
jgi:hypothetical protein